MKRHTDGLGVDVVLEMSGVPSAIHQAFALVRVGGRVQMLGIPSKPIDIDFATEIIFKGLTIYGVVGRRMYDTWLAMTRFLRSGQFDPTPVITHTFPLEESDEAIRVDQVRRGRKGHFRDRIDGRDSVAVLETDMALNQRSRRRSKQTIEQLKADKVYKRLNYLDSPQSARVQMEGRGEVLILSSNNYLGLCDEPERGRRGHRRTSDATAPARRACASSAARSPIHRELEDALAQVRRHARRR